MFAFGPAAGATTDVPHTVTATVGSVTGSSTVLVRPILDSISMTLSATTARIGDTITVTVEGFDGATSLGDVTSGIVVTSDQPGDEVVGNTVTFTHASPHVITARYGTLTLAQTVEVSPRAGIALTGSELLVPGLAAAGASMAAGLAAVGLALLMRRRRVRRP